jgi:proline iminopeptidase
MSASSNTLHAVAPPFASGWLEVSAGHRLYFEERGAPDGFPAVVLHGGPGSGCAAALAGFFDQQRYRVILFDQRGCGRSLPSGALDANRTGGLVGDIERLRRHLGIGRWLVVGGSWGGTLGVLYAAAHPQVVAGLLLRNPFLARQADLDWFFGGAAGHHPAAWQAWRQLGAPERHDSLLPWLSERFARADAGDLDKIARAWQGWESALAGSAVPVIDEADLPRLLARYRLQLHYFCNACFLPEGAVLEAARHAAGHGFPAHVVQGLADDVCPAAATRLLVERWSGVSADWVPGIGHDPFAPPMVLATMRALENFARHSGFT